MTNNNIMYVSIYCLLYNITAFVAKYLPNPTDDDTNVGECGYDDCMVAVAINLAIIFGIRLTLSNAIELCTPILGYFMRQREQSKGSTKPQSSPELQFQLEEYDRIMGTIEDYAELAVQFGYMTLFIAALPIASFVCLVSNYIEIRSDAYKLLTATRRPIPSGAEDIGTWMSIFNLTATICVVTNAGLVVFTMNVLDSYSLYARMWVFVSFQWFCFIAQYIIQELIPDVPLEVEIQMKRSKFITDKLIQNIPDDNDEVDIKPSTSNEFGEYLIAMDCPINM